MREYEELALRAERGELRRKPGTVRRGAESRRLAQRDLVVATNAKNIEEAVDIALGRPRAGQERGVSPQVRTRVTPAIKETVAKLAEREQCTESEIVRKALAIYIEKHLNLSSTPA